MAVKSPFSLPEIPNHFFLGDRLTTVLFIDMENGNVISRFTSNKEFGSLNFIDSERKYFSENVITIVRSDYTLREINGLTGSITWSVTDSDITILEKGSKKEINSKEFVKNTHNKLILPEKIKSLSMNQKVISIFKLQNNLPIRVYRKNNDIEVKHNIFIPDFTNSYDKISIFNPYTIAICILALVLMIALYFCVKTYKNNLMLNEEINNLKEKVSNKDNISVISTNSRLEKSQQSNNSNDLKANIYAPVFKDNFEGEYNSDNDEMEIDMNNEDKHITKKKSIEEQVAEYVENTQGLRRYDVGRLMTIYKKARAVSSDYNDLRATNIEKSIKGRPRATSNDNYQVNKYYNEDMKNELDSLYNAYKDEFSEKKIENDEHIYDIFSDSDSCEIEPTDRTYFDSGRFLKNFEEIFVIGKGGFGCVFKAKHKIDGNEYAIKILKLNIDNYTKIFDLPEVKEIKTMMKLEHKNIVRYITCWFEQKNPEFKRQRSKSLEKSNFWDNDVEYSDSISCSNVEFIKDNPSASFRESILSKKANKSNKKKQFTVFFFMQIEYCRGLSLSYYLENRKFEFNRKMTFLMFKQILSAVHHIHKHGIIHRDLKYNILT
jgi:hypothetical protein